MVDRRGFIYNGRNERLCPRGLGHLQVPQSLYSQLGNSSPDTIWDIVEAIVYAQMKYIANVKRYVRIMPDTVYGVNLAYMYLEVYKSLRRIYLRQSVKSRRARVKLFVLSSRKVVDLTN